jgi:hypothetical protein
VNDDESQRIWKEVDRIVNRYYSGICLEGLRNTTKPFRQAVTLPRFEPSKPTPVYKYRAYYRHSTTRSVIAVPFRCKKVFPLERGFYVLVRSSSHSSDTEKCPARGARVLSRTRSGFGRVY